MHAKRRRLIGCVDQAKSGAAGFVEPVGQEFDAVFILELQVLTVGVGDIGRGQAGQIVTIHEYWHRALRHLQPIGRRSKLPKPRSRHHPQPSE